MNNLREQRENCVSESKADNEFADIFLVMNYSEYRFYRIKSFKNETNYMEEKKTQIQLYKILGDEFAKYTVVLSKFEDITYQLFYDEAECNLK